MARNTEPLQPGEDSINRVTPTRFRDGWAIRWSLKLPNGKLITRRTQGPTKSEVRRRAKIKATELLDEFALSKSQTTWRKTDLISDYMEKITLPAIESTRLSENTRRRYALSYRLLLGYCTDDACIHKHSLQGVTIEEFQNKRRVKNLLEEIAKLHGAKNVKHCKIVLSKYVIEQLDTDDLLVRDPTYKLALDLSSAKQPPVQRGGQALTLDEYQRAIQYLLSQDPRTVRRPQRGRWSYKDRVTERAAILDLVLAQAATGMRTSEIATITGDKVSIDANGTVVFHLSASDVKTRRGRIVPVMVPEVSDRLRSRLDTLPAPNAPLFPTPTDPLAQWNARNRNRKLERLYLELAHELNIPMFVTERGHSWRTTLNSLLADTLPEDVRIRILGHTAEVNRQYYTAVSSTDAVVARASEALFSSESEPQALTRVEVPKVPTKVPKADEILTVQKGLKENIRI